MCDTIRVVPQLLLQLHALLLHLIQLLLQLSHLCMDILHWDELVRLHLRAFLDHVRVCSKRQSLLFTSYF